MARSKSTSADESVEAESEDEAPKKKAKRTARNDELSGLEEHQETLDKLADAIEKGYRDQQSRTEDQADYWDIFECELNDNQGYNGNAQSYVPLIRDSIDARQIRFTNQLFPINGRFVDCITENGDIPHGEMALLEWYIRQCKIRTEVVPALCKNGDVEGQYNLHVSWESRERHIVRREMFTNPATGEDEEDFVEEIIFDAGPAVEVLPDADVLVLPATADSIERALNMGGSVSITRRWSKDMIEAMVERGDIVKEAANQITADMKAQQNGNGQKDMKKEHVSATGIKGQGKWYLARESWHKMWVDDEWRIVRSYFGAGDQKKLGTKLNPYWCDLVPVISCPVKKMSGAFKGGSLVKPIAQLQYRANDFLNQAADSATYSMMPIVLTDPQKNPKISTMILDLAAVWEADPNSTHFAEFPHLWEQGFEIIAALKGQIQQSLGVNPSMIPATSGKAKRSQADIANEQAVDILTTADSVTILEEGILTPMLRRFAEYDAQFRHDEMLIPQYGMMGKRAKMDKMPPLQMNKRIEYTWLGAQAARNIAQSQQNISMLNVIKSIPPSMYPGHRLDLTAVLEAMVENGLGPRIAPLTFVSLKDDISAKPEEENQMLQQGLEVHISPYDEDQKHIQVHMQIMGQDQTGLVRAHIMMHQTAMKMKQQAQMMAQMQQQGGGGPRQGAQNKAPRGGQGAPGGMHKDQMNAAGAPQMPRK
jgi:hypothetical protein